MKKFVVYEWFTDDEGGLGVALTNNFSSNTIDFWSNVNKKKLGEFDTVEELTSILYEAYPDYYNNPAEAYDEDAKALFEKCLHLEG